MAGPGRCDQKRGALPRLRGRVEQGDIIFTSRSLVYGLASEATLQGCKPRTLPWQRAILTVCSQVEDLFGNQKVTLGLPHLVGAEGALSRIPLRLALLRPDRSDPPYVESGLLLSVREPRRQNLG